MRLRDAPVKQRAKERLPRRRRLVKEYQALSRARDGDVKLLEFVREDQVLARVKGSRRGPGAHAISRAPALSAVRRLGSWKKL